MNNVTLVFSDVFGDVMLMIHKPARQPEWNENRFPEWRGLSLAQIFSFDGKILREKKPVKKN